MSPRPDSAPDSRPEAGPASTAAAMLHHFDAWLATLPLPLRRPIALHLDVTPDADRPTEKTRLAAMMWAAERTGLPLHTVHHHWPTVFGGLAERAGWSEARWSEPAFFAALRASTASALGDAPLEAPEDESTGDAALNGRR